MAQHFWVVSHVAETFVPAVGNSELKYSIISMYFFVVSFAEPLNVSSNNIIIVFWD